MPGLVIGIKNRLVAGQSGAKDKMVFKHGQSFRPHFNSDLAGDALEGQLLADRMVKIGHHGNKDN
ncbi:MAG: hypothetical protein V1692_03130 [bacterium]